MKKYLILLLFIAIAINTVAQNAGDLIKWESKAVHLTGNNYQVILSAKVEQPYHIYSQKQPEDAIALPTSINYLVPKLGDDSGFDSINVKGIAKEYGELHYFKDATVGIAANYYEDSVTFKQTITIPSYSNVIIVSVNYMLCTNEKCLPPTGTILNINVK